MKYFIKYRVYQKGSHSAYTSHSQFLVTDDFESAWRNLAKSGDGRYELGPITALIGDKEDE